MTGDADSSSELVQHGCSGQGEKYTPPASHGQDDLTAEAALRDFPKRTRSRLAQQASVDKRLAQRKKRAASAHRRGESVDTAAFLAETNRRISERRLKDIRESIEPGTRPARIAIVGAGPVGLWIAVRLAREHADVTRTSQGAVRVIRRMTAPRIDVFERRAGQSDYGTRRITLAISSSTNDLLSRNIICEQNSQPVFSPTCSINFLESCLRESYDHVSAAGFGKLHFGAEIQDPEQMLTEGYDTVIVACGRRALSEKWREARGFSNVTTQAKKALLLKFTASSGRGQNLDDSLARLAGGHVFVRPGPSEDQGWLWVVDLPVESVTEIEARLLRPGAQTEFALFTAAWTYLTRGDTATARAQINPAEPDTSSSANSAASCTEKPVEWPDLAMKMLDEKLRPLEVSARLAEAAFWRSEGVTHRCECSAGLGGGWVVLAGDAACGRPFYLGSTLNGHLHDTVSLVCGPPWSAWDPDASPFRRYIERYRLRIAQASYQTQAPAKAEPKSSELPSCIRMRSRSASRERGQLSHERAQILLSATVAGSGFAAARSYTSGPSRGPSAGFL